MDSFPAYNCLVCYLSVRSMHLIQSDQVENKLCTLVPPTAPATWKGLHPPFISPTAAFEGKYDSIMNSCTTCYKKAIKGTIRLGQASVTWLIALSSEWAKGRMDWRRGRGLAVYSERLKLFQQLSDRKRYLAAPMTSGSRDSPRVMLVMRAKLYSQPGCCWCPSPEQVIPSLLASVFSSVKWGKHRGTVSQQ